MLTTTPPIFPGPGKSLKSNNLGFDVILTFKFDVRKPFLNRIFHVFLPCSKNAFRSQLCLIKVLISGRVPVSLNGLVVKLYCCLVLQQALRNLWFKSSRDFLIQTQGGAS